LVYFSVSKETIHEDMAKMAVFLEKKKAEANLYFVRGSGKKKSNLQKLYEALQSFQGRQQSYDQSKEILGERNSYSKTDKD
ncbi:hypothetical protein OFL77_27655, partial [Escherichia coli]|nr:hypothetical protein [Escherichia coli]